MNCNAINIFNQICSGRAWIYSDLGLSAQAQAVPKTVGILDPGTFSGTAFVFGQ